MPDAQVKQIKKSLDKNHPLPKRIVLTLEGGLLNIKNHALSKKGSKKGEAPILGGEELLCQLQFASQLGIKITIISSRTAVDDQQKSKKNYRVCRSELVTFLTKHGIKISAEDILFTDEIEGTQPGPEEYINSKNPYQYGKNPYLYYLQKKNNNEDIFDYLLIDPEAANCERLRTLLSQLARQRQPAIPLTSDNAIAIEPGNKNHLSKLAEKIGLTYYQRYLSASDTSPLKPTALRYAQIRNANSNADIQPKPVFISGKDEQPKQNVAARKRINPIELNKNRKDPGNKIHILIKGYVEAYHDKLNQGIIKIDQNELTKKLRKKHQKGFGAALDNAELAPLFEQTAIFKPQFNGERTIILNALNQLKDVFINGTHGAAQDFHKSCLVCAMQAIHQTLTADDRTEGLIELADIYLNKLGRSEEALFYYQKAFTSALPNSDHRNGDILPQKIVETMRLFWKTEHADHEMHRKAHRSFLAQQIEQSKTSGPFTETYIELLGYSDDPEDQTKRLTHILNHTSYKFSKTGENSFELEAKRFYDNDNKAPALATLWQSVFILTCPANIIALANAYRTNPPANTPEVPEKYRNDQFAKMLYLAAETMRPSWQNTDSYYRDRLQAKVQLIEMNLPYDSESAGHITDTESSANVVTERLIELASQNTDVALQQWAITILADFYPWKEGENDKEKDVCLSELYSSSLDSLEPANVPLAELKPNNDPNPNNNNKSFASWQKVNQAYYSSMPEDTDNTGENSSQNTAENTAEKSPSNDDPDQIICQSLLDLISTLSQDQAEQTEAQSRDEFNQKARKTWQKLSFHVNVKNKKDKSYDQARRTIELYKASIPVQSPTIQQLWQKLKEAYSNNKTAKEIAHCWMYLVYAYLHGQTTPGQEASVVESYKKALLILQGLNHHLTASIKASTPEDKAFYLRTKEHVASLSAYLYLVGGKGLRADPQHAITILLDAFKDPELINNQQNTAALLALLYQPADPDADPAQLLKDINRINQLIQAINEERKTANSPHFINLNAEQARLNRVAYVTLTPESNTVSLINNPISLPSLATDIKVKDNNDKIKKLKDNLITTIKHFIDALKPYYDALPVLMQIHMKLYPYSLEDPGGYDLSYYQHAAANFFSRLIQQSEALKLSDSELQDQKFELGLIKELEDILKILVVLHKSQMATQQHLDPELLQNARQALLTRAQEQPQSVDEISLSLTDESEDQIDLNPSTEEEKEKEEKSKETTDVNSEEKSEQDEESSSEQNTLFNRANEFFAAEFQEQINPIDLVDEIEAQKQGIAQHSDPRIEGLAKHPLEKIIDDEAISLQQRWQAYLAANPSDDIATRQDLFRDVQLEELRRFVLFLFNTRKQELKDIESNHENIIHQIIKTKQLNARHLKEIENAEKFFLSEREQMRYGQRAGVQLFENGQLIFDLTKQEREAYRNPEKFWLDKPKALSEQFERDKTSYLEEQPLPINTVDPDFKALGVSRNVFVQHLLPLKDLHSSHPDLFNKLVSDLHIDILLHLTSGEFISHNTDIKTATDNFLNSSSQLDSLLEQIEIEYVNLNAQHIDDILELLQKENNNLFYNLSSAHQKHNHCYSLLKKITIASLPLLYEEYVKAYLPSATSPGLSLKRQAAGIYCEAAGKILWIGKPQPNHQINWEFYRNEFDNEDAKSRTPVYLLQRENSLIRLKVIKKHPNDDRVITEQILENEEKRQEILCNKLREDENKKFEKLLLGTLEFFKHTLHRQQREMYRLYEIEEQVLRGQYQRKFQIEYNNLNQHHLGIIAATSRLLSEDKETLANTNQQINTLSGSLEQDKKRLKLIEKSLLNIQLDIAKLNLSQPLTEISPLVINEQSADTESRMTPLEQAEQSQQQTLQEINTLRENIRRLPELKQSRQQQIEQIKFHERELKLNQNNRINAIQELNKKWHNYRSPELARADAIRAAIQALEDHPEEDAETKNRALLLGRYYSKHKHPPYHFTKNQSGPWFPWREHIAGTAKPLPDDELYHLLKIEQALDLSISQRILFRARRPLIASLDLSLGLVNLAGDSMALMVAAGTGVGANAMQSPGNVPQFLPSAYPNNTEFEYEIDVTFKFPRLGNQLFFNTENIAAQQQGLHSIHDAQITTQEMVSANTAFTTLGLIAVSLTIIDIACFTFRNWLNSRLTPDHNLIAIPDEVIDEKDGTKTIKLMGNRYLATTPQKPAAKPTPTYEWNKYDKEPELPPLMPDFIARENSDNSSSSSSSSSSSDSSSENSDENSDDDTTENKGSGSDSDDNSTKPVKKNIIPTPNTKNNQNNPNLINSIPLDSSTATIENTTSASNTDSILPIDINTNSLNSTESEITSEVQNNQILIEPNQLDSSTTTINSATTASTANSIPVINSNTNLLATKFDMNFPTSRRESIRYHHIPLLKNFRVEHLDDYDAQFEVNIAPHHYTRDNYESTFDGSGSDSGHEDYSKRWNRPSNNKNRRKSVHYSDYFDDYNLNDEIINIPIESHITSNTVPIPSSSNNTKNLNAAAHDVLNNLNNLNVPLATTNTVNTNSGDVIQSSTVPIPSSSNTTNNLNAAAHDVLNNLNNLNVTLTPTNTVSANNTDVVLENSALPNPPPLPQTTNSLDDATLKALKDLQNMCQPKSDARAAGQFGLLSPAERRKFFRAAKDASYQMEGLTMTEQQLIDRDKATAAANAELKTLSISHH